jgi:hypothetical protein
MGRAAHEILAPTPALVHHLPVFTKCSRAADDEEDNHGRQQRPAKQMNQFRRHRPYPFVPVLF